MPHDDFEIEPVPGLPEHLPDGEHVLWQGRPDWWVLAREALSLWWVAGYFAFLALWRFVTVVDLMPLDRALIAAVPLVLTGVFVCLLLMLTAYIQARATLYTVTTARVAMRIGAALTLTLNIPYRQIANASLDLRRGGTGTIAFETLGSTRLSYLVCWPHVRPWRMKKTEPALRCIPDAQKVADIVADAAQARVQMPVVTKLHPAPSAEHVAAE